MAFAVPIPDWNSLDSVRHVHSEFEGAALLFFALLVIFDVLSHLSEDDHRKIGLEKIALCFFAVAVLAEIVAYPYGQRNDTLSAQIISSLDIKAQRATDNSSKALTVSSTALSQATDAAGIAANASTKAGALTARMNGASKKLGVLEKDIIALSPRSALLVKSAPELVKQLEPFAGQRVGLFLCGRSGTQVQETVETWAAIARILDNDDKIFGGAKWKEVPTNCMYFDNCPKGLQGVTVYVSKRASTNTMKAAKALAEGIVSALPPSGYNALVISDPDRKLDDKTNPWILAGTDPDLVTVLIGEHPTQWVEMNKATAKVKR